MFRPGNPMPSRHSQPRPEADETARLPSAAERARTLVQGNASGVLVIPGLDRVDLQHMVPAERSVTADGDVLLLFPSESPAARTARHAEGDDLPAVLELIDVAPVAVPHRIRGRAWIEGWVTTSHDGTAPGWAQLRLEVGEGSVDDLWGAEAVEPDDFAAAHPDPLAAQETELLQHLAAAHANEVRWLCALTDGSVVHEAPSRAVPVALDCFGLRVRFSGDAGMFDARFEFPEQVSGLEELHRAMLALFAVAHEAATKE